MRAGLSAPPRGGSPTRTPSPIRPPPSFFRRGKGGRRGRGRRKGGPRPLPLSNSDSPWGGTPPPCGMPCLSPMAHEAHYFPQGVPVTSWYSDKYSKHFRTIPVSEYYRPIYQSLPLDHFETPRHVCDLIRDSEQTPVIKPHNS